MRELTMSSEVKNNYTDVKESDRDNSILSLLSEVLSGKRVKLSTNEEKIETISAILKQTEVRLMIEDINASLSSSSSAREIEDLDSKKRELEKLRHASAAVNTNAADTYWQNYVKGQVKSNSSKETSFKEIVSNLSNYQKPDYQKSETTLSDTVVANLKNIEKNKKDANIYEKENTEQQTWVNTINSQRHQNRVLANNKPKSWVELVVGSRSAQRGLV